MLTKSQMRIHDKFAPPKGTWNLCESVDEVGKPTFDTNVFCARLRGPVALFDGVSLNNRYYSRALWDQVLQENLARLTEEGLFGVLGHERPIDEDAISNGDITHKVTSLWINENTKTVDGEILVLNSKSGREL